jgi:uncharacterized membrane protein YqaE (UPF0057 family)
MGLLNRVKGSIEMSIWRAVLCVVFPPLAVLDKGCGMAVIVGVLWLVGIFPGIIAALIINLIEAPQRQTRQSGNRRYVEIPTFGQKETAQDQPKRKGAFVRLADGEVAEVIDDDGMLPEKYKREDYP